MAGLRVRAYDQKEFLAENRKDFVTRRHAFAGSRVYKLVLSAPVIAGGVWLIVEQQVLMGALACLVLGIILFVLGKQAEYFRRIITTTEFLNTLLSSSLGAGQRFCMIVEQKNAKIVYMDRAAQAMFPEIVTLAERTLTGVFAAYQANIESEAILEALRQTATAQMPVKIQCGEDKAPTSIAVSLEPIPRPSGFCLVRGA